MYQSNYVVFDTETTGLDNKNDKIIELGAIKVIEGQVIATFTCLINHLIPASKYIPDINHITAEMVNMKGISPEAAFKAF